MERAEMEKEEQGVCGVIVVKMHHVMEKMRK